MSDKLNDGGPVYPVRFGGELTRDEHGSSIQYEGVRGMSIRQFAAIHLRVPNSGIGWLDHMIRERITDDFAAKVMQGLYASNSEFFQDQSMRSLANEAYAQVRMMLEERNRISGDTAGEAEPDSTTE